MTAFERVDPNGDLNTGKSMFYISDSLGNQVTLSQQDAQELMGWLRSFLDPLPIPIIITVEHDERGKQFYSWTAGTSGAPQPWGIGVGATTEFHDAVSNALEQALKYAMRAKSGEERA